MQDYFTTPKWCGFGRRPRSVAERLLSRLDMSGDCWIWTGYLNPDGYGQMLTGSKTDGTRRPGKVHRIMWEMHNGPIPPGMEVCHNCPDGDTPACCNPAHLFLASHDGNMKDAAKKGRTQRGETHSSAKLSSDQIREMRERAAIGGRGEKARMSREFGMDSSHISRIVKGKKWKHLPVTVEESND